jgi:hypothetical protein
MNHHAWFICWDGVSLTFCPGWPWTFILPISASWVAAHPAYWLRWDLANFLPGLASNDSPPNPDSWVSGVTDMSPTPAWGSCFSKQNKNVPCQYFHYYQWKVIKRKKLTFQLESPVAQRSARINKTPIKSHLHSLRTRFIYEGSFQEKVWLGLKAVLPGCPDWATFRTCDQGMVLEAFTGPYAVVCLGLCFSFSYSMTFNGFLHLTPIIQSLGVTLWKTWEKVTSVGESTVELQYLLSFWLFFTFLLQSVHA